LFAVLTFAGIFAGACASPGPTVVALVSRVIGRGTVGVPSFCAGLMLGDMVWLACALFGLSALASLFQPAFLAIRYLGAAYLLFLAWRMWTAPAPPPREAAADAAAPTRSRSLFGGLALALGNPKTMLFYLALLPSLVPIATMDRVTGFAELGATVLVVYSVVLTSYVVMAARARRLFQSRRAVRLMNRTTGTIMAGAAAAVAAGGA
jgi:threonine/homoserine/homoserine lactone efflux protein